MTKKEQRVMDNWVREYNIDYRTLGMIVHHYLDIGERAVGKITPESIKLLEADLKTKQEEAERDGKIYLMTPDFVSYLLTACMGLYKLDSKVRYKIIKENLV